MDEKNERAFFFPQQWNLVSIDFLLIISKSKFLLFFIVDELIFNIKAKQNKKSRPWIISEK